MLLEARNLVKHFGGVLAVSDVSLEVREGEILGLIGPNGAGKTTVVNILSGVFTPDKGTVSFKGQEITGLKPHAICKKGLARTFQNTKPFGSLTVLENLMVGSLATGSSMKEGRDIAEKVLSQIGLGSIEYTLVQSTNLGIRRKIELARALATKPKLILMDEVMAGLNPTEIGEMIAVIKRLRESGITFLVIEHVMKAVMAICDRIVVLDHGVKIAEGNPKDVMEDQHVVTAYLGDTYAA